MSSRIIALSLSFLLCLPLLLRAAQTPDVSTAALPIVNNACEFLGQFEQRKIIAALDEPLRSSGQFYHHCEHGVIWSTTEPITETLVMQKEGKGYLINESSTNTLKSRQAKFLSKLLNSLMSANQEELRKQFAINLLAENNYQLIPIQRKLKRGIKSIDLIFAGPSLTIKIVDRNSQKTEIFSTQTHVFESGLTPEESTRHCQNKLGQQPCSLLLNTSVETMAAAAQERIKSQRQKPKESNF